MTLPYVVDAQTSLSPAELQVLHDQYETEAASGHITTQTKFNYAWALIKSTSRPQMLQGVALLTDIYRTDPPRRRECLYYLALGHYKLSNFDEAKRFNALLLEREPKNQQAQSLNALIDQGIAKEGYIGMALLGGVVTVTGVLLTTFLRRGRR
ncbi:mitochondrial fission 1 protein [Malassezia pachydermatis]|uniref:Mitochondrial fission 1 protein n=1 Tax=Malassezia pachydermatis TaxID=77020 RepID=A0A0M8MMN0_9BASI|nr:mitochondrial fission 1 protein [Malassezia pachydermatis]KOS14638.1 mitochondrial fission 1 protein [Malassezia pachydermatis]